MRVLTTIYYLNEDGYVSCENEKGELEPINFPTEEEATEFANKYGELIDFEESILH